MSGLSQLQRRILRLALAVNAHTQGGTPRVKTGGPVPGYRVPTVDYSGPKDLRLPLVLWAVGGLQASDRVAGFFEHTPQTLSIKAGIVRAMTRLEARRLIVLAPLPHSQRHDSDAPSWGYTLTAEGLAAAGAEPLPVPAIAEACELFGITHQANYSNPASGWHSTARKADLIDALKRATVTEGQICTPVAVGREHGATVTEASIDRPVAVAVEALA
jgi:hypothetical protein